MIGWVIVLFIPAFTSLLLVSLHNNRIKAKKACTVFESRLTKNEKLFHQLISQIIKNNSYDYIDEIIDSQATISFISKSDSKVTAYSFKAQKLYVFPEKKYDFLLAKLQKKVTTYSYSIDSFSLYYQLKTPYENYILRLNYPQNIFNFSDKW